MDKESISEPSQDEEETLENRQVSLRDFVANECKTQLQKVG